MRAKKPLRPIWTTTVDPSEYDYVAQFTQTVKWANKNKELYPPTDVGKVWGLVQAYQRLERENAALRAHALEMASAMRITRDSGSACGEALARAECAELRLHIAKLRATIDAATT